MDFAVKKSEGKARRNLFNREKRGFPSRRGERKKGGHQETQNRTVRVEKVRVGSSGKRSRRSMRLGPGRARSLRGPYMTAHEKLLADPKERAAQ